MKKPYEFSCVHKKEREGSEALDFFMSVLESFSIEK